MLKLPSRRTAQQVDRSRLQRCGDRLPATLVRFQTHTATASQRDSDHVLELRHIAMPPNRRSCWILGDNRLNQLLRRHVRKLRDTVTEWHQILWYGVRFGCLARAEVVLPPVLH